MTFVLLIFDIPSSNSDSYGTALLGRSLSIETKKLSSGKDIFFLLPFNFYVSLVMHANHNKCTIFNLIYEIIEFNMSLFSLTLKLYLVSLVLILSNIMWCGV